MITSAFILFGALLVKVIFSVFLIPMSLLTGVVDFSFMDTLLVDISDYLSIGNIVFPVTTLLTVIDMVIQFELTILSLRFLRWLISFIPFINPRV